jgi:hypothetical protein
MRIGSTLHLNVGSSRLAIAVGVAVSLSAVHPAAAAKIQTREIAILICMLRRAR